MTDNLRLTHDTHVIVCDGRKGLLLRNAGDATMPNLVVEQLFEAPPNPASREQLSDAPGSHPNRFAPSSSVKEADPHQVAENAFVTEIGRTVSRLSGDKAIERLVVVAPPRALAVLRGALDDNARKGVVAEVDKDLTKHPIDEIGRLLTA